MWQSSNPILKNNNDAFSQYYGKNMFAAGGAAQANVTTMSGVVSKTTVLVAITTICGVLGYSLFANHPQLLLISGIASLIIGLGIAFLLAGKPALSPIIAPIYAVVEGTFLGAFTAFADSMLAQRGLSVAGGIGVQAFIVTACVMISMLLLYKLGWIRATVGLQAVIRVAMGGICLAYLASFVLSLFWQPLPLISFASALNDRGPIALVGLGINVFILVIAALSLVIDFKQVEDRVAEGAPKHMEWYCGFALLVTLAWIYYESVKMLVRVASLLGDRK
jgi:uncharacterized YccA/Bax inhibitor family protein